LFAALGLAGPARAQHVEYKASVTVTGSYTKAIADSGTTANYAGPTFALSPSLLLLVDTPRTENTLGYAFSLAVPFLQQGSSNSTGLNYSNRFSYTGHYALSEITNLVLGGSFTESPLNTFVPSQDPTAATVQTAPTGSAYLFSTGLTEGVTRLLSERTNFGQAASFLYGHAVDPTSTPAQTFSATNSFSFGHVFLRDQVGVTLTNQVNYITTSETAGTTVPGYSAWVNTLTANWQRSLTEAFSIYLAAGALQVLTPDATTFMQFQPTGSAMLNYNFLLATAGLAYSHGVQPNVATGTVNFSDAVSLRFSAPIRLTGLTATGTLGYTHSVPLGTPTVTCSSGVTTCAAATTLTNPSDVYAADLGLDYHPERVPTLTVGVRGQVARQVLSDDATNSFFRYTAALNLTYSYPNARAAGSRPQLTPLFSAQPPTGSDVVSTERFFSTGVAGPDPAEPPPKPKGP
jgi:hypothetical protein